MKIDNYDVSLGYGKAEDTLQVQAEPNQAWYSAHVPESQSFLQMIKCADTSCCSRLSGYFSCRHPVQFFKPQANSWYLVSQTKNHVSFHHFL